MVIEPQVVIAAIGLFLTWTLTIIGGTFWLSSKFTQLDRKLDQKFDTLHFRLLRLEFINKIEPSRSTDIIDPTKSPHEF